jgi:hypothetical protein
MKKMTNKQKAICVKLCDKTYDHKYGCGEAEGIKEWEAHENGVNQWYSGVIDYAAFGTDTDVAVIVFRGSDQGNPLANQSLKMSDWAFNKNTELIREDIENSVVVTLPLCRGDEKAKMFEGSYDYYSLAKVGVRRRIMRYLSDGYKRILITGHSLGGNCTTTCYADIMEALRFDLGLPVNCSLPDSIDLTGYAAAAWASGNSEWAKVFDTMADGHFFNEWFGSDPVHDWPASFSGAKHVRAEKRHDDVWSVLMTPFMALPHYITFGYFTSLNAIDHHPHKLECALEGKPIPRFGELKGV